jgi:hypothetical protein
MSCSVVRKNFVSKPPIAFRRIIGNKDFSCPINLFLRVFRFDKRHAASALDFPLSAIALTNGIVREVFEHLASITTSLGYVGEE